MRDRRSGIQLNCFSPPVMLATLTIESCLAVYTIWRYKFDTISRLTLILLVCLASFQLAEYNVCTGYGFHAEQWSRAGFVLITILPIVGIHLMYSLAGKSLNWLVYLAYLTMAVFIGLFLTYATAFIGHQCTGNYVIFQLGAKSSNAYYTYYFGWLGVGIALGAKWANELSRKGKYYIRQLNSVRALLVGYLIFLVPTLLAMMIKPQYRQGIPSVMCGFAVLFALILSLYILPRNSKLRTHHHA